MSKLTHSTDAMDELPEPDERAWSDPPDVGAIEKAISMSESPFILGRKNVNAARAALRALETEITRLRRERNLLESRANRLADALARQYEEEDCQP